MPEEPEIKSRYLGTFLKFLLAYVILISSLSQAGDEKFIYLHLLLDTSNAILSLLLAVFLLSAQYKLDDNIRKQLVIAFSLAAFAEILHASVGVEWGGHFQWIDAYAGVLRPATWPPSTYVLPIAMALSLWLKSRKAMLSSGLFLAVMTVVAVTLFVLAWVMPQYSSIGAGIDRPTQIPLLIIWVYVIAMSWRYRTEHHLYEGLAWMGVFLFMSDLCMLFSTSPHEKFTMMAHSGKLIAYMFLHVIQMQVSAEDSKGRLRAETALSLEKERLSAALRDLRHQKFALDQQAIVSITDVQGTIIYANDNFCAISGYSREELLGQNHRILKSKEHSTGFFRDMYRAIASGKVWHGEICNRAKDGHLYWVIITLVPFMDEMTGKPVEYIAIRTDITERKQAELKAAYLIRRNRLLMQSTSEGIHILDDQAKILEANDAFCRHLGYTQAEILQLRVFDFEAKLSADEVLENLKNIQGDPVVFETIHRRKDGTLADVEIHLSSVDLEGQKCIYALSRDITERKRIEEKVHQLAFHDPLTQLPNRQLLVDRLQHALASSTRGERGIAVLFIDLDNFKTLNDTLGHATGDMLLQQVAERLVACVRQGDTVARLGGDEFVVILEDLHCHPIEAADQAEAVGEKILAVLSQIYQLGTHAFRSSGSIGAAVFSEDLQGAEELLKQADIAMYQAKRAGRNALRFFNQEMQEAINTRALIEAELHMAIEHQQFELYYQVQVDRSRTPLGAEALIRWNHPVRGQVSPIQFIPLAEETGQILHIGLWVLETACAQLKAWARDEQTRNLILAVNISARQFHQDAFVGQVKSALMRNAINPALLKLELTESMLLENTEDTIATMSALKAIGVQLSLDDFGTGYSSLQYLKLLPLNQIKIDQSFVRNVAIDPNDAAIVQTIIAMTEALGLDVIAEGVETEAQREFLDLRGCHAYQGFLFGEPVSSVVFEGLLRQD